MTAPDPKLTPWLLKHLRELNGQGSVTRVELYQALEGAPVQRLLLTNVSEGVDAHELTQEIWDTACQDASTRSGGSTQRYVVATFQDEDPAPLAQMPFIMPGGTPGVLTTAAPNDDKAERGMLIKHTENMHRLVIEQNTYHTNLLRNELEAERRLRTGYEENAMKTFEMMQTLMDRQHERLMESKREESKEARHQQLLGLLMSAAPLLLAQVMGGAGLKGAGIARDEGIREFLKGLSEKEINGIIGSLNPANAMVLMELYKSYSAEEKQRNPLLLEAEKAEIQH